MKSTFFAVVVAAVVGVLGCSGNARTQAGQLRAGDKVSLTLNADGTSAQAITSETLGDGETNDDGEPSDGDGETNDDAQSPDTSSAIAGEVLAQRSGIRELSAGTVEALGMKIQVGALPDGSAVRFSGVLNPDGTFIASTVKSSLSAHAALKGTVQSVERTGNGMITLRVLGMPVTVSESATVTEVASLDEESAKEDDGVECAQEGAHEGDNEGCAAPTSGGTTP